MVLNKKKMVSAKLSKRNWLLPDLSYRGRVLSYRGRVLSNRGRVLLSYLSVTGYYLSYPTGVGFWPPYCGKKLATLEPPLTLASTENPTCSTTHF